MMRVESPLLKEKMTRVGVVETKTGAVKLLPFLVKPRQVDKIKDISRKIMMRALWKVHRSKKS